MEQSKKQLFTTTEKVWIAGLGQSSDYHTHTLFEIYQRGLQRAKSVALYQHVILIMVHSHATFSLQKGWLYKRGITILKSYTTQCLGNLNVDFKICDDFYCK